MQRENNSLVTLYNTCTSLRENAKVVLIARNLTKVNFRVFNENLPRWQANQKIRRRKTHEPIQFCLIGNWRLPKRSTKQKHLEERWSSCCCSNRPEKNIWTGWTWRHRNFTNKGTFHTKQGWRKPLLVFPFVTYCLGADKVLERSNIAGVNYVSQKIVQRCDLQNVIICDD